MNDMTSEELIAAIEGNLIRAFGRYSRCDVVAGNSSTFMAGRYAEELQSLMKAAERDPDEVDHWGHVAAECRAITESQTQSEAAERADALVDGLTYGPSA